MPSMIYTGGGHGGSLPGLPARDLSADEVERLGGVSYLLSTGLYEVEDVVEMEPESIGMAGDEAPAKDGDTWQG